MICSKPCWPWGELSTPTSSSPTTQGPPPHLSTPGWTAKQHQGPRREWDLTLWSPSSNSEELLREVRFLTGPFKFFPCQKSMLSISVYVSIFWLKTLSLLQGGEEKIQWRRRERKGRVFMAQAIKIQIQSIRRSAIKRKLWLLKASGQSRIHRCQPKMWRLLDIE